MSKITRSITVDEEVWNQAKDKAGSRKLSSKIQEMLEDYVGHDSTNVYEDTDILDRSNLTEKQKKAVRLLIKEERGEVNLSKFMNLLRKEGIYDRPDFVKKAVKRISKDDFALYEKDGGKLVVQEIECFCGSRVSPTALDDGHCRNCGTQLLDLEKEEAGLQVV